MKFSDGSVWAIPVSTILYHHALATCPELDKLDVYINTVTKPLLSSDETIIRYVRTKMKWRDMAMEATCLIPQTLDFDKEILDCHVKIT